MSDSAAPARHWATPKPPPAQPAISGLDYEGLQKCIHCGFCIQACPTYRATGSELASPRGRLALMRAVAEGALPLDEGFADPIDLCLGCRACETACPSGVPYGRLLEQARDLKAAQAPTPWPVRFALRHLLPHPARLRLLGAMARLAQRLGLFRLLPLALREAAWALPPLAPPRPYPAPPQPRTLFFHGCVQEELLHHQNRAAVALLHTAGLEPLVPAGQRCCGALHAHSGDLEGARRLARATIALFERYDGLIVNHAGGCGAHLKEYGHLLKDDPDWASRARAFADRVRDLAEVLDPAALPLKPRPGLILTYQDSCHLAHGQRVRQQPRRLLRAIPGAEYREMAGADQCCGSAGIYNMLQPDMASQILTEKMQSAAAAEATVLVTANPGCFMQVCQGVRRHGLQGRVTVRDLAEVLYESIGEAGP